MIQQNDNGFSYLKGADVLGEITFVPAARGQGIATQLLDALAAYARENQVKIVPQCSYVQSMFDRHAEKYRDVIAGN